jgi:hypothetical protein
VAKLLFVSKMGRPDIQVAIAFLTSHMTAMEDDDWKKLHPLLKYLHSTIPLPLILSIDNFSIIKTWVDASYAIHPNLCSHTGGAIMMGKGVLFSSPPNRNWTQRVQLKSNLLGPVIFISNIMD